jgi:hypothetical protein
LARPAETGNFTSREIQKAFVNRDGHQRGRIFFEDAEHPPRKLPVIVIVRFAQHAPRTKPRCLEARHAGLDAELFGHAIGGNDDAIAAPSAADPDRAALQLGMAGNLATGEETVAVHVQDANGCAHDYIFSLAHNTSLCQC